MCMYDHNPYNLFKLKLSNGNFALCDDVTSDLCVHCTVNMCVIFLNNIPYVIFSFPRQPLLLPIVYDAHLLLGTTTILLFAIHVLLFNVAS